jgi:hypothetical protein
MIGYQWKQAVVSDQSVQCACRRTIGFWRIRQRAHGSGRVSDVEAAEEVRLARRAITDANNDPEALWIALSLRHFLLESSPQPPTSSCSQQS